MQARQTGHMAGNFNGGRIRNQHYRSHALLPALPPSSGKAETKKSLFWKGLQMGGGDSPKPFVPDCTVPDGQKWVAPRHGRRSRATTHNGPRHALGMRWACDQTTDDA